MDRAEALFDGFGDTSFDGFEDRLRGRHRLSDRVADLVEDVGGEHVVGVVQHGHRLLLSTTPVGTDATSDPMLAHAGANRRGLGALS